MKEIISTSKIEHQIYRVRGRQVMLDADLSVLYSVETKYLKRAVKRNLERFPPDFMFRLSTTEVESLRCQFGTLKRGQHSKYLPYAFTQEGIAMLSSVLRSHYAIRVNIAIMRTFIRLRHAILSNRDVQRRIEKVEGKIVMHDTDIRLLREDVRKLSEKAGPPPSFKIRGFEE